MPPIRSRISKLGLNISIAELLRYTIVGVLLNVSGYLIYIVLTANWLSPMVTVSILYPLGTLAGYFAHGRHTFGADLKEFGGARFVRYVLVYAAGFVLNLLMLYILYEQLGYPHQLVQVAAVFVVAGFLYLMMKKCVFSSVERAHQKSSKL